MINTYMQAFVYMWQDIGVEPNKFYIGRKIGDYFKIDSANSYQTSSKLVAAEMKQRPNDFRRFLIDCGTKKDMALVEAELLQSVDAAKNPLYYNRHNEDGKFINNGGHIFSEKTKRKMSESSKGKPKSEEHKKQLSLSHIGHKINDNQKRGLLFGRTGIGMKGKIPWNKGTSRTEEQKKHHSEKIAWNRGIKTGRIEASCIYCKKVGHVPAMYSYHFDNCRNREL